VPCYGEVWTDEDVNILRISQHLELPGKWRDYQSVVTYGWLTRTDEVARLIPLTISTNAQFNKKVYRCRPVHELHIFTTQVKILKKAYAQTLPPAESMISVARVPAPCEHPESHL
jgi:hypothetical protein